MTLGGALLCSAQRSLGCGQSASLISLICQRGLSACTSAFPLLPSQPEREDRTYDASTSSSSLPTCKQRSRGSSPAQQQQWHAHRHFSYQPNRPLTNPSMPAELVELIHQSTINRAVRPDPLPIEARPMRFESRRAGVIAIKAGMMQDWDEYGARVPLTVLWIDECMVSCSCVLYTAGTATWACSNTANCLGEFQ